MFSTEIRAIVLFSGEKWRDEMEGWRGGGMEWRDGEMVGWKSFWSCGNFLQIESGELLSK
ncbi:hypothetical protein [Flavihumibacter sp. ZG627]|uniref:hypothetical protein n=1 Tax=Flavihumibacter sp. ZG627 TaxID=1463156 RepID=UPI0005800528|nr:hypothetical protein [Flavihumibacter sp. ZG627]KIC92294.1 hypothetical protein HY58_01745 [Flavihumibacter sp. ZG627]